MPAKPQWITRITDITQLLSTLSSPVVDRRTVEQLFGVKRRRANDLMLRSGRYQSGNVFLIDRDELLSALRSIADTGDVAYEIERRQRVGAELATLDRHARAAAVLLPVEPSTGADLPEGILVTPGTLTVHFHTAEELFGKLYSLVEFAAMDFERIGTILELTP